ncbi:MAG: hypothetical protein AB8B50_04060 [Pirellulaceae bacterium]
MRYKAISFQHCVLLVLIVVLLPSSILAADLAQILAMHEESLSKLRAIDVQLEITQTDTSANSSKLATKCRWQADTTSGIERISIVHNRKPVSEKDCVAYEALLMEDGRYRFLRNYDWDSPAPLGPNYKGGVEGDEGVIVDMLPGGFDPRGNLLLIIETAPSRDLRAILKENKGARLLKDATVNGHECYVVDVPLPEKADESAWASQIFLDKNAGCMIRKIVQQSQPFEVQGETIQVDLVVEANNMVEQAEGVYLPDAISIKRSDSKFDTQVSLDYASVNEPLDSVEFNFPEWCWVRKMDTGETYIADGNGGTITSWKNPEEMNAWFEENYPNGLGGGSQWGLFTIPLIVCVVLGGLWGYRRFGSK